MNSTISTVSSSTECSDRINARFAALEAQNAKDCARLAKSEKHLRVTWAMSALIAVTMLTIGWNKEAIAQGYGMTLAQAATRITALETKTASMSAITDPNTSKPTVRFTGVNVQIVDGSGVTEAPILAASGGVGNLIIGYNELRGDNDARNGNHNLITGIYNNYGGSGGVVFGYRNNISSVEASVTGGVYNTASSNQASITGGFGNTASGKQASVTGGRGNQATGDQSSVSGGEENTASGLYSSILGGESNIASGQYSCVSGGYVNTANASAASVTGGASNTASGAYSTVAGGNGVVQSNNFGFAAGGGGSGTFHSP